MSSRGATLNEIVTAGSWFWWLITSGALMTLASTRDAIGIVPPAPIAMPVLPCEPMPLGVAELLEVAWPKLVALLPVSTPLPLPRTLSRLSRSALVRNFGSTSRTTRYWLSWVKMVEIWRWPKAE